MATTLVFFPGKSHGRRSGYSPRGRKESDLIERLHFLSFFLLICLECCTRSPGGGHGNLLHYFCLENPHGQGSLMGYGPECCKESDTTEWLSTAHLSIKLLKNYLFIWLNQIFLASWGLSLQCMDSLVVAHGLSCSVACGILVPGPGVEPASPALQDGFVTTGPSGKSQLVTF